MSGSYELHQKLRTKAVRQLKKKDYDGAITSLYDGSRQLLESKDQGSGCDLACYLVDVYTQADKPSTEETRQKIITLISLAGPDFWRKKVIDAAIRWSTAVTDTPSGDGHLRLAIADILSKDGDYYASEVHYIAACCPPPGKPSASEMFPANAPKSFALMMVEWLASHAREAVQQSGGKGQAEAAGKVMAGSFALRGLIPLLLARSFTSSRGFLSIFVNRVTTKHPTILLQVKPNPKPYTPPVGITVGAEVQQMYSTSSSDLNFAQMAFALVSQAVEHKKRTKGQKVSDSLRDSWVALIRQFEKEAQDEEDDFFFEAMPQLSQIYFDMQPARGQGGNFMQDMLGSLMGGGAAGGSEGKSAAPVTVRRAPAPRVAQIESNEQSAITSSAPDGDELDLD